MLVIRNEITLMAMQSFRGAGGVGAVCVRSAVVRTAVIRHGLAGLEAPPAPADARRLAVLRRASTLTAVLASALAVVWWVAA